MQEICKASLVRKVMFLKLNGHHASVRRPRGKMMNRTLLIICLLINGCASTTNRPIDPVMYKGSTTSKSELIGFLRMNTGEVTGYSPAAMIYVDPSFRPVLYNTYDAYPNYLFEEENLEVFFESLKTELLERGMIRSLSSSYSPDKLEIVVRVCL